MIGKIIGDRLFSSGIGGPFYSMKCGLTGFGKDIPFRFIFPLFTPFALLLCAVCPPAYAVVISRAVPPRADSPRLPLWRSVSAARGELLFALLLWWLVMVAGYEIVSLVISSASADLSQTLAKLGADSTAAGQTENGLRNIWQQANDSQMKFATLSMSCYFSFAFVLMLALFESLTLSMAGLSQSPSPVKLSLRAVFVNLPGYIALVMVILLAFAFIEQQYSSFKIRYMSGFMFSRQNFDPTWPFLILRIYLLGAFCAAAALCSALSLRLWRPFGDGEKVNGSR
jgi:hypothetical protein